jgi:hypothetical protein
MADINEVYGQGGGNYIKTQEVQLGSILECEITGISIKDFGEKKKLVADLKSGKAFVLNPTNARALAQRFANPDYTQWVGKTFRLIRTSTNYQGSSVDCLRVV